MSDQKQLLLGRLIGYGFRGSDQSRVQSKKFNKQNKILSNAFKEDIILSQNNYTITPIVKDKLIMNSGGDARKMLNTIDIAINILGKPGAITSDVLDESFQNKSILYDKTGDYHYDTVSALIKSMRGSDPDAAIYWLSLIHI